MLRGSVLRHITLLSTPLNYSQSVSYTAYVTRFQLAAVSSISEAKLEKHGNHKPF